MVMKRERTRDCHERMKVMSEACCELCLVGDMRLERCLSAQPPLVGRQQPPLPPRLALAPKAQDGGWGREDYNMDSFVTEKRVFEFY